MATKQKDANLIVKAENDKFRKIGRMIVATEQRAEYTVRDSLMECFGYSPPEIACVKEGIKEAYKERIETLYTSVEVQTTGDFHNVRAAIYNRQSEKMAILEAFRLAAGWTKTDCGAFRKVLNEVSGYHELVSLCRACVQTEKAGGKFVPADVRRAKWQQKFPLKQYLHRVAETKDSVALVELREAINKRLALLKPKVNVISLAAKRKAKKAVGDKAASAFGAVNKRKAA